MNWVRIGARCRCVSINPRWAAVVLELGISTPIVGGEYTVRSIVDDSDGTGILLEEITNPKIAFLNGLKEPDFGAFRFRPIVDIDEDMELFTHHLISAREPENA